MDGTPSRREHRTAIRSRWSAPRVFALLVSPVLFAGISLLAAVPATGPSPALTPDSVQYLSAAQNIAAGEGPMISVIPLELHPLRMPFAAWPPLFPLLLSAGVETPPEGDGIPLAPLRWARLLNLLALTLSFFPLAFLAYWMAGPRWVPPTLALYAVFRPTILAASFVWSETLFTFLTLAALGLLVRAIQGAALEKRTREREEDRLLDRSDPPVARPALPPSRMRRDSALVWFLAAGLVTGLAAGTRYLGLAVAAAGGMAIVLRSETEDPWRLGRRLAVFLLPAVAPLLAWVFRNRNLTGYFFGEARGASGLSPEDVFHQTLRVLAVDWFAPPSLSLGGAGIAVVVVGALAAFWLVAQGVRRYGPWTLETRSARLTTATALLAFVILYLGMVAGAAVRVSYDPMNTRLLMPAYPILLVLVAGLVRGAWKHPHAGRRLRGSIAVAFLLVLGIQAAAGWRYAHGTREDRSLSWPYWRTVVWSDPSWRDRPEMAFLRTLPDDTLVLSNTWEAVALHTGLPVKPLPPVGDPGFPGNILRYGDALILVEEGRRPDVIGVKELLAIGHRPPGVVAMASWDGAVLFRITHGMQD